MSYSNWNEFLTESPSWRYWAHIMEGYTANDCFCLRNDIDCLPGPSEAETL